MNEETQKLCGQICKLLDDKKASNIVVVDIAHLTIVADCFVICSGRSTTQVKGLSDYVEEELSRTGLVPLRKEGKTEGRWAVLDYGGVIVHIFQEETRTLYSLEQLWGDGANVKRYPEEIVKTE